LEKNRSRKYRKCSNYLIGRNSLENIKIIPIIDWKKFSRKYKNYSNYWLDRIDLENIENVPIIWLEEIL